jgi:2-dehydro-3-deoxy-D-arabinonate dehydratase
LTAIWNIEVAGQARLAIGAPDTGPEKMLDDSLGIDDLYTLPAAQVSRRVAEAAVTAMPADYRVLAPVAAQEIWAAGVTYERSRQARSEESVGFAALYDKVYEAERPELFLKQAPGRVRSPDEPVGIRSDSTWDVPEPEIAVALNADGEPFAYTIANDVSSRSIEGENPLYLPQAKIYRGSCSVGPCLVTVDDAPPVDEMVVELTIDRDSTQVFTGEVSGDQLRRTPDVLADFLFAEEDFPNGVLLLTGTGLVPDDFTLQDGDDITIRIAGLGVLHNTVSRSNGRGRPRNS